LTSINHILPKNKKSCSNGLIYTYYILVLIFQSKLMKRISLNGGF